jgi:hypothetical protein
MLQPLGRSGDPEGALRNGGKNKVTRNNGAASGVVAVSSLVL